MKRAINALMTTTLLLAQTAWSEDGTISRIRESVGAKLREADIRAGVDFFDLGFDLGDVLHASTGLEYQYILDPDSGRYLRQDRWKDKVRVRVGAGLVADREVSRQLTYGRYHTDWKTAATNIMFSPYNLKNLNSSVLQNSMRAGDMASITLNKATFLGLDLHDGTRSTPASGGVRAGKIFSGKITVKILKEADGKITLNFANADENAVQLAGSVSINIVPGLLRLKLLSIEHNARLRGTADLATFTYDLSNPTATAALDKILQSFDEISILQDERLLREGISLDNELAKGLIDVVASDEASTAANSGVIKTQNVSNNIVSGQRTRVRFRLIPNFIQSNTDSLQSMNLVNMNMGTSQLRAGQYLVGYRSETKRQNRSRIQSISSVVYQPSVLLTDNSQARGYRGLDDLVGISYHTEARRHQNVKELLTYAKLCNAGILQCGRDIQTTVVADDSAEARQLDNISNVYSNYFFAKGLFVKIKERMNWDQSSQNQKQEAIKQTIRPLVTQFVVDRVDERTNSLSNLIYDALEHGCYSNLIGISAREQRSGFFKRIAERLWGECNTSIYDLAHDSDTNIRNNIPALLIALYNPTIFGDASNPYVKASAETKADLAKYFAVSINTRYQVSETMERTVNGLEFGLSNAQAGQVMEFSNLIDTWQQQSNNTLTFADRQRMLRAGAGQQ
ncbi:hypothetical protein [Pseudobdellovibrio exovorus]|uniref:Uncharacterized protein n=1 Tax=Pseudobdellovibrio exovorus JSS TaxID=1184267 RepID=M4VCR0_9BACT|nr:hypothetical protein [Pseudobdellovibrio exovorus]AGH96275.1 hypothetical protein A11Q_2059 [Pseudobdellovibrio exovorus JSS]